MEIVPSQGAGHLPISLYAHARPWRLREDVVVTAKVEGVFDELDEPRGRVLVDDRPDQRAGFVESIGLGVAREGGGRIDMHEPGWIKAQHAAIGLREGAAGGLEVDQVRLERAVDAPPMHVAHDLPVVDLARRADEFLSAKPALEAGAEVLDAEELDRLILLVGQQVNDPPRWRSS
ncbi:MAG: hypothetical protein QM813_05850 [Verrucomicrobiota bacterium]